MINSAYTVETFLEGTRTDPARLAEKMCHGELLLAESPSGQLIGCVYTEVRSAAQANEATQTCGPSEKIVPHGYLGMLAVDPAHQHSHFGRTLMRAAEDHLRRRGCAVADLDVISWRKELPPIYHRYGYVDVGIQDFDPGQPVKQPGLRCRAILMSKPL